MQGVMLDTNVFNALVDNKISRVALSNHRLVATHVQIDELQATSDEDRRTRLKDLCFQIVEEFLLTSSAVWDVSRWDQAKWGDCIRYQRMFDRLVELDRKSGERIKPPNQERDVLIAETALCHDFMFASQDSNLITMILEEGGRVLSTTPPSPPNP